MDLRERKSTNPQSNFLLVSSISNSVGYHNNNNSLNQNLQFSTMSSNSLSNNNSAISSHSDDDREEKDEVYDTNAKATTKPLQLLSGWMSIVTWITLGYFMILFNKALLSTWDFGYPFFLTSWHCLFSTILTQVLARTTNMLPGVSQVAIIQPLLRFICYRN